MAEQLCWRSTQWVRLGLGSRQGVWCLSIAVRIGDHDVQEEAFDLDAFASTPVHLSLVNYGRY